MLRVTVTRAGTGPADLPRPGDGGVQVWWDHQGRVAAYGGSANGAHWMRLPGVGIFVFGDRDDDVVAYAAPDVEDEAVLDAFRRAVLPMALQRLGQEVLHASAVAGPAGVIGLCAVSGTGKSTLAYGLGRRGYRLWADDALAFEPRPENVVALPLPFTLNLRPPSARYFGIESPASTAVAGDDGDAAVAVVALHLLERMDADGGPVVEVQRLSPIDAFPALLVHAYCFTSEDSERKRGMIQTYLEVAARVPVFRVRLAAGLERIDSVLDAIEEATGA